MEKNCRLYSRYLLHYHHYRDNNCFVDDIHSNEKKQLTRSTKLCYE